MHRVPEIQLRPIAPDDLAPLYKMQAEPRGCEVAVARPRTRDESDAHWLRVLADPACVSWGIVLDSRLIGNVVSFRLDGKTYLGYWIAERFWGRGIASEAVRRFLAMVMTTRPVHARVATSNAGSVRVLQKNGFVTEKTEVSEESPRFPSCEEAHMVLRAEP